MAPQGSFLPGFSALLLDADNIAPTVGEVQNYKKVRMQCVAVFSTVSAASCD